MKCKDQFEYVMMLINDYLNTLPPSIKLAVTPHAQQCASAIAAVLQEGAPVPTAAAPTAAPIS